MTNNANTSSFEQTTLPFGTALNSESTGVTNRRFTSYDRNELTQLDYAVNRHYDPRQGRFTQVDPIGMGAASLAEPQSLNLYAYVGNDPINRVDPDGLFWGSVFRFVGRFFGGLFSSLRPTRITGSLTYGSLPPVTVSFSGNFQNVYVGFAGVGFQVRGQQQNPYNERKLTQGVIAGIRESLQKYLVVHHDERDG